MPPRLDFTPYDSLAFDPHLGYIAPALPHVIAGAACASTEFRTGCAVLVWLRENHHAAAQPTDHKVQFDPVNVLRHFARGVLVAAALVLAARPAAATALLLVEADSGKVLHSENATYPWYPASITKLMTAYVTLQAIAQGRITLETLFTVSEHAVAQQPTKMGFRAGTQVTVDNALKMMMVHSANDMAVLLAEGVAGSVENFADLMNQAAQHLGMTQSSFVNPNGLPAEGQVTSARDMAILARALIREFPEYGLYWRISAIKLGRRIIHNTNSMITRYPGADGMKTGFICAAGYNLVVTATRSDKRLIAVILGAPSSGVRAARAAQLFEKGFNSDGLSWLLPSLGTVEQLTPIAAAPPDLHDQVCGNHRHRPATEAEAEAPSTPPSPSEFFPSAAYAAILQGLRSSSPSRATLTDVQPTMPPVEVFVGPPKRRAAPTLAGAPSSPSPGQGSSPLPAGVSAVPLPRPRPK
jgi:D-alanyl-D-alanine carboxypeptidase